MHGDPLKNKKGNKSIPRISYILGSGYYIGVVIFDNLVQYLAIMLGSAGVIQGFLTSFRQFGTAFLNPLWGYLSDRFDRRWFLFLANIILSLISFIIPYSKSATFVLILVVIQTLFGVVMFTPSWLGYLGDHTEIKTRGEMIGKISSLITWIGNMTFLITAILMDIVDPGRNNISTFVIPFYLSGFGFLFAAIISIILPKDKKESKLNLDYNNNLECEMNHNSESLFQSIKSSSPFKKMIVAEFIFSIAWGSAWPIFPYVTFNLTETWLEIGMLAFAIGLSVAISQRMGGFIVDKVGRRKVIIWSRLFLVAPPFISILAITTEDIFWLYFMNILVGLTIGGASIAIQTLVLDSAPEDKKATFISIQIMAFGLGSFIGSTLVGIVLEITLGNVQPSLDYLINIFLIITILRFLAWFSYLFIEDTKIESPIDIGPPFSSVGLPKD